MRALLLLLAACSNASSGNVDAPVQPVDAAGDAMIDGPILARILVVNEVAAGDTPDWIEIVNITNGPVQLADFAYVDVADDFVKMKPFPAVTLPAGAYYTQDVDDTISGFKLASDEEVWVYRIADHVLSDGVNWDQGASPAGMSYRRIPDTTGNFATGAQSKGLPNP
jgi:hypothetical protein